MRRPPYVRAVQVLKAWEQTATVVRPTFYAHDPEWQVIEAQRFAYASPWAPSHDVVVAQLRPIVEEMSTRVLRGLTKAIIDAAVEEALPWMPGPQRAVIAGALFALVEEQAERWAPDDRLVAAGVALVFVALVAAATLPSGAKLRSR